MSYKIIFIEKSYDFCIHLLKVIKIIFICQRTILVVCNDREFGVLFQDVVYHLFKLELTRFEVLQLLDDIPFLITLATERQDFNRTYKIKLLEFFLGVELEDCSIILSIKLA